MAGVPILLGAEMPEGVQVAWVLVWLVLVTLLVVALVFLALSRWGRSQPVRICVVLSLLAHVLLAGYAATIQIVRGTRPTSIADFFDISMNDEGDPNGVTDAPQRPWDQFSAGTALLNDVTAPRVDTAPLNSAPRPDLMPPPLIKDVAVKDLLPKIAPPPAPPTPPAVAALPLAAISGPMEPTPLDAAPAPKQADTAPFGPPMSAPDPVKTDTAPATSPTEMGSLPAGSLPDLPRLATDDAGDGGQGKTTKNSNSPTDAAVASAATVNPNSASNASKNGDHPLAANNAAKTGPVPEEFRLRVDADRVRQGARHGGSPDAEAAVQAGLRWLAAAQAEDGRWEAARNGAGRELHIEGRDRQGAGMTADTAMTGLALLSFLGSGNTHRDGPYKENVRRGLEFLMSIQRQDGSLAGNARLFGAMYCHGIASFALSEAYAMTRDQRLYPAVSRAAAFIVASQHPTSGGWRYQPGDPGDTSQLGWQVMALRSAEIGGVAMPDATREGIRRFLDSVATGQNRGLASYRANQAPTRTMTAEALSSRVFMGMSPRDASRNEAAEYILTERPGEGQPNFYYWYYGTLSLYQLQDRHWERWNQALQKTLITAQRHDGEMAGSWDADALWGGYGGRVYSTGLATLCLEVYYRYLPLYGAQKPVAAPVR